MEKARDGVFLVTSKKTDDDEGDHEDEDKDEHEHEHDESEWNITLKHGPWLALQGAEAQEGKVTFGSAVRES
jgi:hypothetical protein